MKTRLILFLLPIMWQVGAQSILNAKTPADIRKKEFTEADDPNSKYYDEPLPYGHVDDKDILWSRNAWEIIDLEQKINFPLYFRTNYNIADPSDRSLFDAILSGIESGKITEVYGDSYFSQKLTLKELRDRTEKTDTTALGIEQYNRLKATSKKPKALGKKNRKKVKKGKKWVWVTIPSTEQPQQTNTDNGIQIDEQYIDRLKIRSSDVKMYKIRGLWYFDKRLGELRYRPLGIAPVALDVRQKGDAQDLVELFWVWYPEARKHLHKFKIYNSKTALSNVSYDDAINARRFSGVIYKYDNEYGDREVKDYLRDFSTKQLLESERVKEIIRSFENDMWYY